MLLNIRMTGCQFLSVPNHGIVTGLTSPAPYALCIRTNQFRGTTLFRNEYASFRHSFFLITQDHPAAVFVRMAAFTHSSSGTGQQHRDMRRFQPMATRLWYPLNPAFFPSTPFSYRMNVLYHTRHIHGKPLSSSSAFRLVFILICSIK
jgi:hypothetical protein